MDDTRLTPALKSTLNSWTRRRSESPVLRSHFHRSRPFRACAPNSKSERDNRSVTRTYTRYGGHSPYAMHQLWSRALEYMKSCPPRSHTFLKDAHTRQTTVVDTAIPGSGFGRGSSSSRRECSATVCPVSQAASPATQMIAAAPMRVHWVTLARCL